MFFLHIFRTLCYEPAPWILQLRHFTIVDCYVLTFTVLICFRIKCCMLHYDFGIATNIVGNTNLQKGNFVSQFTFYILIVNIE